MKTVTTTLGYYESPQIGTRSARDNDRSRSPRDGISIGMTITCNLCTTQKASASRAHGDTRSVPNDDLKQRDDTPRRATKRRMPYTADHYRATREIIAARYTFASCKKTRFITRRVTSRAERNSRATAREDTRHFGSNRSLSVSLFLSIYLRHALHDDNYCGLDDASR